ncbi:hypothetical protein D3C87_1491150 [compost metagenome]
MMKIVWVAPSSSVTSNRATVGRSRTDSRPRFDSAEIAANLSFAASLKLLVAARDEALRPLWLDRAEFAISQASRQ